MYGYYFLLHVSQISTHLIRSQQKYITNVLFLVFLPIVYEFFSSLTDSTERSEVTVGL